MPSELVMRNSIHRARRILATALALALLLVPAAAVAGKKKEGKAAAQATPGMKEYLEHLDYSRIVWPNPPAITRIKFSAQYTGQKLDEAALQAHSKKKSSWMDRLAGVSPESLPKNKVRYVLGQPFGVAVDSKGLVYVADEKVGAIFIFNTETKDVVDMIKHGAQAKFGVITGLAIDDSDRLFVADAELHHVLVFNSKHQLEGSVSDSMEQPVGVAIDNENRFLYVADSGRDQVLVYDADNYRLLRKIGTYGKKHTLTEPGQFSRPVAVTVDRDGNLYVSDTFNNRVEIFDADGEYISTFGKAGDGPGYLARPKGIATDCDGHIWVVDSVQNRVQVFNREGRLLIWFGGTGLLPGQMSVPVGITIDKDNRVFTTEQFPGRLQEFRYITQPEALAEKKRRDEEDTKKASGTQPVESKPATPAAETPAKKDSAMVKPG